MGHAFGIPVNAGSTAGISQLQLANTRWIYLPAFVVMYDCDCRDIGEREFIAGWAPAFLSCDTSKTGNDHGVARHSALTQKDRLHQYTIANLQTTQRVGPRAFSGSEESFWVQSNIYQREQQEASDAFQKNGAHVRSAMHCRVWVSYGINLPHSIAFSLNFFYFSLSTQIHCHSSFFRMVEIRKIESANFFRLGMQRI